MNASTTDILPINVSTSVCFDLRVIDALPHHPCYNWNHTQVQCEIDWPCEVRQYLVSISPFIGVTRGLLSYGTLVIIILGLFLNLLSVYTLVSSGLSKSGSGIYLISLAVCDCGNLLFNYLIGISRAHVPRINDLFMASEWLCRWHGVFVEVFQLISAWIVVSFTVERCLAIWYPMLLRHTSRTGRAKRVVFGVGGVLTVFSLTKLVLTGFEKDSVFGYSGCYSHRYRWQGIAYVRVAFQTWIPTVLVFVFNLLMFCKLRQLKKARKRLTEVKRKKSHRQGSFINRPSPTAPMLMAVSLAYLVLVFPLGVVQTVELIWKVENKKPVYELGDLEGREEFIKWKNTKLLLKYVRSFCFGFYQINFCINFFLYFAAGLQFRIHLQKKVKQVFRRCCGGDGDGGGVPEPATPGTSSSALDSRRGSLRRSLQRRFSEMWGSHRNGHGAPGTPPPPHVPYVPKEDGGEQNGGGHLGEVVTEVEVIRSDLEREQEEILGNDEEEDRGISLEVLNTSSPPHQLHTRFQEDEEEVEPNSSSV